MLGEMRERIGKNGGGKEGKRGFLGQYERIADFYVYVVGDNNFFLNFAL